MKEGRQIDAPRSATPVVAAAVQLDDDLAPRILGPEEKHLRTLDNLIDADIFARGSEVRLTGPGHEVQRAKRVLKELVSMARRKQEITSDTVKHAVNMVTMQSPESVNTLVGSDIVARRGKVIRPKTAGQKSYVDAIDENTITFGIGPAGSGKTYLAMAKAVQALQAKQVTRIILTRPAVEAGRSLASFPAPSMRKLTRTCGRSMTPSRT